MKPVTQSAVQKYGVFCIFGVRSTHLLLSNGASTHQALTSRKCARVVIGYVIGNRFSNYTRTVWTLVITQRRSRLNRGYWLLWLGGPNRTICALFFFFVMIQALECPLSRHGTHYTHVHKHRFCMSIYFNTVYHCHGYGYRTSFL